MGRKGIVYTALFGVTFLFSYPLYSQETSTGMSVQADDKPANNLYYDAVKAEMLGNNDQAEDMFLQFLKIKPNIAAAYFELSKINAKSGKGDKAQVYIKKAIELDDSNKWYKEHYASLLANNNQFLEAAEVLDQLANTEKRSTDYLTTSAMLYERAGKYKEALANLNKALAKNGPDEDMLLQKEQIFVKQNDLDSTAAVVNQLISLDPKESKYYRLLAELYDNHKEADKALKVYQDAEKLIPDDPSIEWGMAEHYRKNNDTANFDQYAQRAILNRGLDVGTKMSLFVSYLQALNNDAKRKKEGLFIALKIIEQHPDNADAYVMYGDVLRLNGQNEKAIEQYKKAVGLDPSQLPIWQELLSSYADKKYADSLIRYSDKALRLFPNQAVLHYLRGIGEMNKGDNDEAIRSLNRAIDLQPEDNKQLLEQMYSSLGELYNNAKQYSLSDSCMEKALRYDPDNATLLNNYAYYLSERGANLDKAEKMSKRSLELQPMVGTYLDTYAWIMYKQGEYRKAREYEQKAIDADKENADGTYFDHLGDIYFKSGDIDKAVENWQKAKQKGVDNPMIDKKIQERKLYE